MAEQKFAEWRFTPQNLTFVLPCTVTIYIEAFIIRVCIMMVRIMIFSVVVGIRCSIITFTIIVCTIIYITIICIKGVCIIKLCTCRCFGYLSWWIKEKFYYAGFVLQASRYCSIHLSSKGGSSRRIKNRGTGLHNAVFTSHLQWWD